MQVHLCENGNLFLLRQWWEGTTCTRTSGLLLLLRSFRVSVKMVTGSFAVALMIERWWCPRTRSKEGLIRLRSLLTPRQLNRLLCDRLQAILRGLASRGPRNIMRANFWRKCEAHSEGKEAPRDNSSYHSNGSEWCSCCPACYQWDLAYQGACSWVDQRMGIVLEITDKEHTCILTGEKLNINYWT